MSCEQIDFVVPWVNDSDPKWRKKYNDFAEGREKNSGNDVARFEDYGTFKYWFRAVEKYAPWVHKIYLITDHQVPGWINKNNSKIVLINHEDYIPEKYLPTFNSNVIELCIPKINSLSNNFVLFNDDLFINKQVYPNYFFKNQKPVDVGFFKPITPVGEFDHIILNNVSLINQIYNKRKIEKKNFLKYHSFKYTPKQLLQSYLNMIYPKILGFYDSHSAIPYRKDTYQSVCNIFKQEVTTTLNNKFRTNEDVSHWLVRYFQIASGNFVPKRGNESQFYTIDQMTEITNDLKTEKHAILCINDPEKMKISEYLPILKNRLKEKFPKKSEFEI